MLYLQKNQWRFLEWARERATQDYLGRSVQQDGYWSKDLEYRPGLYLRGPADDVTLHQYGACNICWSFGDAVCVTALATAVCICKRWCQSCVL